MPLDQDPLLRRDHSGIKLPVQTLLVDPIADLIRLIVLQEAAVQDLLGL